MLNVNELYNALKENMDKSEISTHESDLYVKMTDISTFLISNYEYKANVTTFTDNIDHELWYEIPFGNVEFHQRDLRH